MEDVPHGWQGILDPEERIVWQGRPGGRLDFRRETISQAAFGAPLLIFGLIWMGVTREGAQGFPGFLFPLIGLGMVLAGLWKIIGLFLWDAWVRRHSWYTLTDRRAFIATDLMGKRSLRSWPVDAETLLDYDGETPGTIWFAEEYRTGRRAGRRRVGFEQLSDARMVHDLMRRVQRRQA